MKDFFPTDRNNPTDKIPNDNKQNPNKSQKSIFKNAPVIWMLNFVD